MKLPISIFPNVTEYARANWTGYLKPAQVKLDSYSIREKAQKTTTITQRPDGVIVMKKKANNAWGQGDYNVEGTKITISNIPANSAIVVVHEMIADAPDWANPWTKESATDEFAGNPETKVLNTSEDGKHELVKVCGSKTAVSGTITLQLQYGYEGYHTVYFAFYDKDRLDACLSGNHLKSI